MSDVPTDLHPETKKGHRARKSQLRVVFDSDTLFVVGSASDLVRQEVANLISDARYPDLDIFWYLPEIGRHERQYQMQAEALKFRSAIDKIERLLGHNLALTDEVLLQHVKTRIEEKEKELRLQEIKLEHGLVDWPKLIHAAAYRNPPFEAGSKEKGFRDALVAESFLQLLATSPKTPSLCRVVLVTADNLLTQAVKERITDSPNASVLATVEELKGLINTIVSNAGEEFIAQLKPKAAKLFFVSSDEKETVFYKEKIDDRLEEKFKSELQAKPEGTSYRKNGTWLIDKPNFSRKEGRRIFWTSRIEIEMEAGTIRYEEPKNVTYLAGLLEPQVIAPTQRSGYLAGLLEPQVIAPTERSVSYNVITQKLPTVTYKLYESEKTVMSHKGRDKFEVLWSTEVTMSKELKKPIIEDLVHVELSCQPIS